MAPNTRSKASGGAASSKTKTKAKVKRKAPLEGMVFVVSGKFSKTQAAIAKDIEGGGGIVRTSMAYDDVTHVITTVAASRKVNEAKKRGLEIADEEWLQAQLQGDGEGATSPPRSPKRAKKADNADEDEAMSTPTSKKAGLSGVPTPDIHEVSGVVDCGLKAVNPSIAKKVKVVDGFDVRLALVEPAINSDKFYLLQLLSTDSSPSYYVFARWGRTGTSGQGKLDGPYKNLGGAEAEFSKRFKAKTAYNWEDREDASTSPKPGKYTCLHYDAEIQQQCEKEGAVWQYYLKNDPMGKKNGWYDYDTSNSREVDELFSTFVKQGNKKFSKRFITSETSGFTYQVDLEANTQTNSSSGTVRPIRRSLPGEKLPAGPPSDVSVVSTAAVLPVQAKAASAKSAPSGSKVSASAAAQNLGGSVDAAAPQHLQHGSIYGEYDIMLNQADLRRNANKFIKVQLIVTPQGVTLHKRWGRVGEAGQQQQKGPLDSDKAEAEFAKYFKSKTGNEWEDRADFEPMTGKYDLIEMETDADEAAPQLASPVKGGVKSSPCELPSPVKEFVELIFDEDMFKNAMQKLEIDATRLPLGALSKSQVQKGRDVLERIQAELDDGADASALEELAGEFYTVIPHAFGRRVPPAIKTEDALAKKFEMLNTLDDIESAQTFMKEAQGEDGTEQVHPTDLNYKALRADLEEVTAASSPQEWKVIKAYLDATCGSSSDLQLEHVLRVNRHHEDSRFKPHDKLTNRRLLWHGTNVAVVAAILKSGLRIMPNSGGRVGRGIYLADQHEKSSCYACSGGGDKVIMFLVEAALGKEYEITDDDSSLVQAPAGYQSVVARGNLAPDSTKDTTLTLDGRTVTVPQGEPKPTGLSSNFHHSEFLIYDESQHRIRYVLQFAV